jgi:hypothetical protein
MGGLKRKRVKVSVKIAPCANFDYVASEDGNSSRGI